MEVGNESGLLGAPTKFAESPVNAYNEWDPLEEVIVGVVEGAVYPPWSSSLKAVTTPAQWPELRRRAAQPFPVDLIRKADKELEVLVTLLESAGITVRRPEAIDTRQPVTTPWWRSEASLAPTMPRDSLLIVANEIIEAPMAWRCRYFETHAYRQLLLDYWRAGARWTTAPRPTLATSSYRDDACIDDFVITEHEPLFDAADFVRCGRDLFVQRSHVTNWLGINWVRHHLGDGFRIHELVFTDARPMHIDATFLPLGPGKVLVNPERVKQLPPMFSGWNVIRAPHPNSSSASALLLSSRWISMNVLMLDPEHVVVEAAEAELSKELERAGLTPIRVPFAFFGAFGGGFHCATADVRRRGKLESYF
jgi:glycine amidinotransferase